MHRIVIAIVLVSSLSESAAQTTSGRRRSVRHPSAGVTAPLAVSDNYSVRAGESLTIAAPGVLANDTLNGAVIASVGPLTGAEQTTLGGTVATAHGGSLSLAAGGGFTYTPSAAFSGSDAFKYTIRNGGGSSSATATIDVQPLQALAVGDSYTTAPENALYVPPPGVLTNDTLAGGRIASFGSNSGSEQTVLGASTPTSSGGTVSLNADGSFSYTTPPTVDDGYGYTRSFAGLDSFAYVIQRDSVSSTAFVNINVTVDTSGVDFVVTSPGHYYAISGLSGENPILQLTRGKTYKFEINAASAHPFAILDAPPGSVTNNNITQGTLTFVVPMTAQNYRYRCTTHGFGNVINTVP